MERGWCASAAGLGWAGLLVLPATPKVLEVKGCEAQLEHHLFPFSHL